MSLTAKVLSSNGSQVGSVDLPDAVFGATVNEHVLYQVIKMFLANQRQGTSKTKTRAEVSGGGRKPWKQKGTGRARAGSNTSPLWVRGSKAHGPKPRDYYSNTPRSLRMVALASALSARASEEKIMVVEGLTCEPPKTKTMATFLKAAALSKGKNLLIVKNDDKNSYLSGRNIPNLQIRRVADINAYDIMKSENVIFGAKDLISDVEKAVAA